MLCHPGHNNGARVFFVISHTFFGELAWHSAIAVDRHCQQWTQNHRELSPKAPVTMRALKRSWHKWYVSVVRFRCRSSSLSRFLLRSNVALNSMLLVSRATLPLKAAKPTRSAHLTKAAFTLCTLPSTVRQIALNRPQHQPQPPVFPRLVWCNMARVAYMDRVLTSVICCRFLSDATTRTMDQRQPVRAGTSLTKKLCLR